MAQLPITIGGARDSDNNRSPVTTYQQWCPTPAIRVPARGKTRLSSTILHDGPSRAAPL